jgi:alpha-beta hydrolase superfamily lysophospholipase
MVEGGARLAHQVDSLEIPLLLVLGTSDPIIDPDATKAIYEKIGSPDKKAYFYADSLHEPLNDLDRDQVVADIVQWLRQRIPN